MSSGRFRAWTFTINNHTFDDLIGMIDLKYNYLCWGFEICPKTKTPHIQGYIYFPEAHTLSAVSKLMPRAHAEPSRGTAKQNQIYTDKMDSKSENWYEFGDRPEMGKARWDLIEDVMADPKQNITVYNQYRKAYKEIKNMEKKTHERVLLIADVDQRYNILKECPSVHLDDEDTYDGEDVFYVSHHRFPPPWIQNWINGYPTKIKRGYEIITIDPCTVYLEYKTNAEFVSLHAKYGDAMEYTVKPDY